MDGPQDKRGYLKKTGGKSAIGKGWKKRWFFLSAKDGTLTYYPKEGASEVLGEINLITAHAISVSKSAPEQFMIEVEGRNYEFQAADSDEAILWIKAIKTVMNHFKSPGTQSMPSSQPAFNPSDGFAPTPARAARPRSTLLGSPPAESTGSARPQSMFGLGATMNTMQMTSPGRPRLDVVSPSSAAPAPAKSEWDLGFDQPSVAAPAPLSQPEPMQASVSSRPKLAQRPVSMAPQSATFGGGDSHQADLAAKANRILELEADLEVKNEIMDAMQRQIDQVSSTSAVPAAEDPAVRLKMREKDSEIARLRLDVQSKTDEIRRMGELLDEMTAESQHKDERMQELAMGAGSSSEAGQSAFQELKSLRFTLQQKDSEISLLKSMMGNAESGMNEQAQMQIQLLEQTVASKTGEVNQLQQSLQASQVALQQLRQASDAQVEKANAALEQHVKNAGAGSGKLNESVKGEAAFKAQMDMANLRVLQAQSKAQDAEAALAQTSTELASKSQSLTEAQTLINSLYAKLKKAMEELKRLREGNAATDEKELKKKDLKISSLETELDILRTQLKQARASGPSSGPERRSSTSEEDVIAAGATAQLQGKLRTLEAELLALKKVLEAKENQIKVLHRASGSVIASDVNLEGKVKQLSEELRTREDELASVRAELTKKRKQLELAVSAEEQSRDPSKASDAAALRLQRKNELIASLTTQVDDKDQLLAKLKREHTEELAELKGSGEQLAELTEVVKKLKTELETRSAELEIESSNVSTLKAQFAAAYDDGKVASRSIELESQLLELQKTVQEKDLVIDQSRLDRDRLLEQLRQADLRLRDAQTVASLELRFLEMLKLIESKRKGMKEKLHRLAEELERVENEKLLYARKLKIMKDEYRKLAVNSASLEVMIANLPKDARQPERVVEKNLPTEVKELQFELEEARVQSAEAKKKTAVLRTEFKKLKDANSKLQEQLSDREAELANVMQKLRGLGSASLAGTVTTSASKDKAASRPKLGSRMSQKGVGPIDPSFDESLFDEMLGEFATPEAKKRSSSPAPDEGTPFGEFTLGDSSPSSSSSSPPKTKKTVRFEDVPEKSPTIKGDPSPPKARARADKRRSVMDLNAANPFGEFSMSDPDSGSSPIPIVKPSVTATPVGTPASPSSIKEAMAGSGGSPSPRVRDFPDSPAADTFGGDTMNAPMADSMTSSFGTESMTSTFSGKRPRLGAMNKDAGPRSPSPAPASPAPVPEEANPFGEW